MCACDSDFICERCAGTPQDWRYFEDEPEPPEPYTAEEP